MTLKNSLLALTLALGLGEGWDGWRATPAPPENASGAELQVEAEIDPLMKMLGCLNLGPSFEQAYQFRISGVPLVLAHAVVTHNPDLHPFERYVLGVVVEAIYMVPDDKLVGREQFHEAAFQVCMDTLGTDALFLPEDGQQMKLHRRDL